jgi:hypothetical protein
VAAGVVLRDPAHADQRGSPAAQQQFLQVTNLFRVACLLRLDDPLPYSPYLLLLLRCRQSMAFQSGRSSGPFAVLPFTARSAMTAVATGSVAPNLPIWFQRFVSFDSSRATWLTSAPFGSRHMDWYTASYARGTAIGGCSHLPSLSCCLSAVVIRFLAILFPPQVSASLTVRLPVDSSTGLRRGFHVSHW